MFSEYPDLLTSEQVCDLLQIGKNKLYEILKNKTIPSVKYGKKYLIPKKLLIEYIVCNATGKAVAVWYQEVYRLRTACTIL